MTEIYNHILKARENNEKLFAVLIDPDKMVLDNIPGFVKKINGSIATHIFVGGSRVNENKTDILVREIKRHTLLPVILFPGDVTQISKNADAILYLSLISCIAFQSNY